MVAIIHSWMDMAILFVAVCCPKLMACSSVFLQWRWIYRNP